MPTCAACGRKNPADARFCSGCATPFERPRTAEERKIVTVLFADVAGSTELADRLDPEELRDVMSAWYAGARSEIEAQGGTVEKYIGDAVMAVFGVPVAHEDDPARALRAALGLRERLVALNRELSERHGVGIEIRTGINTGEGLTSTDPPPGEAMVTGVSINVAARLEQLAEPGQILVADRTARSATGFRFEDLGELALRGKQARVRAHALLGISRDRATRGLPGVSAPLVGRERELDLLLALQERVVAEERSQLVTIYGDPGVGKSRLVQEFVERLAATAEPAQIVSGRCLSYGEGITFWPLAEILKQLAGLADDAPAELTIGRIAAFAAGALANADEPRDGLLTAALAFTLGLDSGDAEFARLQPSALRIELHRTWRLVLSAVSMQRPLVVVVDDIHWADRALLDLLEEVAERSRGPLLIVCPSRPELTDSHPTWGGGRRSFSSLSLGPLTADSADDLVGHLVAADGLADETRSRILERAEGNPFFLEEILRHLIDTGGIVRDGDRWHATDELLDVELPDTVQAVLAARIDLLDVREKQTLQQASVVGRTFWTGAVAALVDDRAGVDPALRRLEERELVSARLTSTLAGEEELAFTHILTRDVAYETLPRRERPRAHARVAAWIEQTVGDRRGEVVGLLAHHYREAFRGAKLDRTFDTNELETLRARAFELLLEASHAALRGAAYATARSLGESAFDLARTPEAKAAALEALGHGHGYAMMGEGAWQSYARAVDTLVEAGSTDDERIARLCGRALESICRFSGTIHTLPPEETPRAYLELGLERLGPGDSEGRVRLLTAQSFWSNGYPASHSHLLEPELAREAGEAAAEMAERIGRPDLAVVALDAVQHNLQRAGRYTEANAAARHRLELARSAGDTSELSDSYATAAWNATYVGAFEEAVVLATEGYELLRSDAPLYALHTLAWKALACFHLGDWSRVLAELDRIREGLGERADTPLSGFSHPWPAAAYVHEARGDRAASEHLLDQVYRIERDREALSPHLSPIIVRVLILRGDLGAARERMDLILAGTREQAERPFLLAAEAELMVHEERWSELAACAESLRRVGALSGVRYLAPIASRTEGRSALAAGDASGAVPLLESAADGLAALGMTVDAAVARLDLVAALGELGLEQEARAHASSALAVFDRVGFLQASAQARALLGEAS